MGWTVVRRDTPALAGRERAHCTAVVVSRRARCSLPRVPRSGRSRSGHLDHRGIRTGRRPASRQGCQWGGHRSLDSHRNLESREVGRSRSRKPRRRRRCRLMAVVKTNFTAVSGSSTPVVSAIPAISAIPATPALSGPAFGAPSTPADRSRTTATPAIPTTAENARNAPCCHLGEKSRRALVVRRTAERPTLRVPVLTNSPGRLR